MDLDRGRLERIKKIATISLFSDDDLMDKFVLKGGNALNLIYKLGQRASIDIDVSMENDVEDVNEFAVKLEKALTLNFDENGFKVFDVKLSEKPSKIKPEIKDFWGGYCLEFKVIEKEKEKALDADIEKMRKQALILGEGAKKSFKIDISKYEYCKDKQEEELDFYTIYVYSPLMIVYEKLRAICQQNHKYRDIIPSITRKSRPKDFYDIYYILEHTPGIEVKTKDNLEILRAIFDIKRVPLHFLGELDDDREFHRSDFESLKATVAQDSELRDFDFYFDYVKNIVESIKFFWEEQSPAI